MADGTTKPIEDVQVGDLVLATDPETGEQGPRRVTDLIVGEGLKELVDVEVDGEIITATDGHPFWVDDEGRWVDADDLETGDRLLLADGTTVAVDSVRERTEVRRVHNLTVEGIHTYHVLVGDEPVLVHNCLAGSDLDLLIQRGGRTTTDFEDVATRLAANNGISREVASARLHKIKAGVENNRDVVFDRSGGVYDGISGDHLGSLTSG